jgi:NAD(P)-dependent dehydrogenase (short-subunit alcohol dehydrogenase family)
MEPSMKGRTCVVTGATTGIGRATVRELAAMGADLVIVARDEAKARDTKEEIQKATPGAIVDVVRCDFGSLASIRKAGSELRKREKIHVLINNHGAVNIERQATVDGFERTFAVNHLGYFLLTHLLRDRLEAAGTPERTARIVNVASTAHSGARIDFEDPMYDKKPYSGFQAYGRSKLANILFTYELARRLEGKNVTANALHPGVVATGFGLNNSGWLKLLMTLGRPLLWTAEKGARTSVKLAASPEVEGVTGKYFDQHGRMVASSRESMDVEAQRKLWALSEKLCGLRG